MSRSYKKHPVVSDDWTSKKLAKRWANKKIRKDKDIPSGKYYRRKYETWYIRDYRYYWTEEEARQHYRFHKEWFSKYKNEDEYIRKVWFPCCKRK